MRRSVTSLLAVAAAAGSAVPAHAIMGGRDASRPYPYMGALLVDGQFNCGASLVAPQWALTAAHCVVGDDGEPGAPASYSVLLGSQTLSTGGERIRATEVHAHPSYGRGGHEASHDVALLRLSRASAQPPIALADPGSEKALWAPGIRATVTGWGATNGVFGGSTERLQEVDVPMVSDDDCETTQVIAGFQRETMVCAGEIYGTRDSCYGDSGGPLVVTDRKGGFVQAGVVSFGFNCGLPTQYGVYARVGDEPLNGWIAERIAPPPPGALPPPVAPAQPWTAPPASEPAAKKKPKKKTRTVKCRRSKRSKRCVCPKGYRKAKSKPGRCVKKPKPKRTSRRR